MTRNFFSKHMRELPYGFIKVQLKITDELKVDTKLATALDREHLLESREQILNLITNTANILKEQEYDRIKEDIGEEYLRNLDSKILWLTIVQILVFIGSGAWVLLTIKNFIKDK
mmetsp:Transcript_9820/g.11094  ORF Transcript_9820/g.11094 Transcript_9820/m.11094 type:complete len:115 (+) Transcript_9820:299-643(+)